jgi:hypothetical protein
MAFMLMDGYMVGDGGISSDSDWYSEMMPWPDIIEMVTVL